MALVGHVDGITRSEVTGWAADPDNLAAPVGISVRVNGEQRLTGAADQPRAGLAASTRGRATDRSGFRFQFDPPLSPFHELRIEVVEAVTGKPLPGGVHVLARPRRDGAATLSPIVVTSTGGEAVTQLLGEFARHPAIVIADRPPYETRQIAYYAATFAALTGAAASVTPRADTPLVRPAAAPLGPNPQSSPAFYDLVRPRTLLQTFYETRVPAHYAELFRTLVLEFYETLRAGQGAHTAPYFCERGELSDATRQAARLFFPSAKELLIVRDPRNVLAVAISTFKMPAEQAMAALRGVVAMLAEIHAENAPDTLVLRYEDLVQDPSNTRRAIGGFLGLDLTAPELPSLATGETPSERRWRQLLAPEQAGACEAEFASFMESFDYRPEPLPVRPVQTAAVAQLAPMEHRLSGVVVAAEGPQAIGALRSREAYEVADGQVMKPIAKLEFGRGQVGVLQLGSGWSRPEDGFVWSAGAQSELMLPPLSGPGPFRVCLAVKPLLLQPQLPEQTVSVLANAIEIGAVALRSPALIAFDLPPPALAAPGRVSLTLLLPNAAKPSDFGSSSDRRQLGISLFWLTVLGPTGRPG